MKQSKLTEEEMFDYSNTLSTRKLSETNSKISGVLQFLHNIDCINRGGCGFSAMAIYKTLVKRGLAKDDLAIVYFYKGSSETYELNSKFINGETKTPSSCFHAVVRNDGDFFDSGGLVDPLDYDTNMVFGKDMIWFVELSIGTPSHWNPDFDRSNVKKITKELGVRLPVYDKLGNLRNVLTQTKRVWNSLSIMSLAK